MKDLTWLKNRLIAHRGLHTKDGHIPENSLASYKQAIDQGYAIELDVNILKDGTVVCFHDHTLKRMCGVDLELSQVTYDDIKELKLLHTNHTISTLSDVLKFIDKKVPLLIELKPHGNVKELTHAVMDILKNYDGTYALFSFHPKVVYLLKKHYPEVIRGQIAESFSHENHMHPVVKKMMKYMVFNPLTKPDFISYGIKDLPNKSCDKLKKKGITIISYAARNQKEFTFVKSHYDNVVFEYFIPKNKGE